MDSYTTLHLPSLSPLLHNLTLPTSTHLNLNHINITIPLSWQPQTNTPLIRLTLTLLAYSILLHRHTRFTAAVYTPAHLNPATKLRRNIILISHIIAGLTEMLRWHIRALWEPLPGPDVLDVALCLVQAGTNMALVRELTRGLPIMTRPVYQAAGVLRVCMTVGAWYASSGAWHASSVKIVNSFIYARYLVYFVGGLLKVDEKDTASVRGVYNFGVAVSAILAAAEGEIPHMEKVYVVLVVLVAALNRWTTAAVEASRSSSIQPTPKHHLLNLLIHLGFVELCILSQQRGKEAEVQIAHDPE